MIAGTTGRLKPKLKVIGLVVVVAVVVGGGGGSDGGSGSSSIRSCSSRHHLMCWMFIRLSHDRR